MSIFLFYVGLWLMTFGGTILIARELEDRKQKQKLLPLPPADPFFENLITSLTINYDEWKMRCETGKVTNWYHEKSNLAFDLVPGYEPVRGSPDEPNYNKWVPAGVWNNNTHPRNHIYIFCDQEVLRLKKLFKDKESEKLFEIGDL